MWTVQTYNLAAYQQTDDATLSNLELTAGELNTPFQSLIFGYASDLGYLIPSVGVIPTASQTENPNHSGATGATITVDLDDVASGQASDLISVPDNGNVIPVQILVTAEDGVTTQLYDLDLERQTAITFAQEAYLKASNSEAGDEFGGSIALSGDTLAVGVPNEDGDDSGGEDDSGAVYIFVRNSGVWSQQGLPLKALDLAAGDQFGAAVALDGDTLAIGAPQFESGATANTGKVYIFTRTGATWTQQTTIEGSTGADDNFGLSLALDNDTLVVGAPLEDAGGITDSGAVYIFTGSGASWSPQGVALTASNAEAGDDDQFGASVAIDGDTIVAGAPFEDGDDSGSQDDSGAVYVFTRTLGVWSQQGLPLKAGNVDDGDEFGTSVAISGESLAAGAPGEDGADNASEDDSGATYVFTRSGGTWTQQGNEIKSTTVTADAFLGVSVALEGDLLAAGADAEGTGNGAVYTFTRNSSVWTQQDEVTADNAEADDGFGEFIALDGDTLAIIAAGEDSDGSLATDNTAGESGAAYVFQ